MTGLIPHLFPRGYWLQRLILWMLKSTGTRDSFHRTIIWTCITPKNHANTSSTTGLLTILQEHVTLASLKIPMSWPTPVIHDWKPVSLNQVSQATGLWVWFVTSTCILKSYPSDQGTRFCLCKLRHDRYLKREFFHRYIF